MVSISEGSVSDCVALGSPRCRAMEAQPLTFTAALPGTHCCPSFRESPGICSRSQGQEGAGGRSEAGCPEGPGGQRRPRVCRGMLEMKCSHNWLPVSAVTDDHIHSGLKPYRFVLLPTGGRNSEMGLWG